MVPPNGRRRTAAVANGSTVRAGELAAARIWGRDGLEPPLSGAARQGLSGGPGRGGRTGGGSPNCLGKAGRFFLDTATVLQYPQAVLTLCRVGWVPPASRCSRAGRGPIGEGDGGSDQAEQSHGGGWPVVVISAGSRSLHRQWSNRNAVVAWTGSSAERTVLR